MWFSKAIIAFLVGILLGLPSMAQEKGQLNGQITDTLSNPIEGVNISIRGLNIGTTTDQSGKFSVLVPTEKELMIYFSHVSYHRDSVMVFLKTGESKKLDIRMSPNEIILNQVEVAGNLIPEDRQEVSAFHLDPVTSKEIISPFSDFTAILSTLPGVVASSELSSSYSVRGGNFDENLVFVNNIPIYRPILVRSGQQEGLSFVNPNMVSDIGFYAGGWGSRYGDKLSSVLDIKYKTMMEWGGSLDLSLLGGSAHLQGNINPKANFAIGVRHKNSKYLLNTLEVDGEYLPNFTDVQTLFNYRFNDKSRLSWLFAYSENNYQVIPASRTTDFGTFELPLRLFVAFDGNEKLKYKTFQSGINFERQFGKLINNTIVSGYYSYEREYFDVEGYYQLCILQRDISQENFDKCLVNRGIGSNYRSGRNFFDAASTTIENKSVVEIDAINQLSFGVGYTYQFFDDQGNEFFLKDSADYVSVEETVVADKTLKTHQVYGYISHDVKLSPGFNVNYGLRAHYHDVTEQLLLNPRMQVSWKPSLSKNIVYRAAAGVYHQPPFYREFRNRQGEFNEAVKAQSSFHSIIGFDYELSIWDRPFKLTGEGYYKYLWNVNPYEIDNVKLRYFAENSAVAYAAGVDFRISGEFISGDQSWFSLGILKTEEDISGDEFGYVSRPSDQRVNAAIFFQDHIPNLPSFKVNLTFFYNTPLPFYAPNSQRNYYFRGEEYQRVDIGFLKEFYLKNSQTITAGVELLNMTDNENTISYSWIQDVSGSYFAAPNTLSARYLNVRIRYEF